jgi:hypothetical protein
LVRFQSLIARKVAELFGFNPGIQPFYAACHLDELSKGYGLCLSNTSFKTAVSQCHNFLLAKIDDHGIRRGNTGQIIAQW